MRELGEFKIVETEDGFRIEIKGDKEAIRRMLAGFGPKSFFKEGIPFDRGFHFDFGPGFWAGFGCGPWWDREEGKAKKA
jgi:hypothetical protein